MGILRLKFYMQVLVIFCLMRPGLKNYMSIVGPFTPRSCKRSCASIGTWRALNGVWTLYISINCVILKNVLSDAFLFEQLQDLYSKAELTPDLITHIQHFPVKETLSQAPVGWALHIARDISKFIPSLVRTLGIDDTLSLC